MDEARKRALTRLSLGGIVITQAEAESLEVADFGLGRLEKEGLEIVVYANNDRYCAKELILFPHQTCPEHKHPSIEGRQGKQETFRCRAGVVYLYTAGDQPTSTPMAMPPEESRKFYTVHHEHILTPGMQYTIGPNVLHWFQAGPDGAIVSEFSSPSFDEGDEFTDPNVERVPKAEED